MKILMVNKYLYPRGGSESYMLKLGNYLSSLGHEVQYFGMFDEKNTVGNKEEAYTQNMDFHSAKIARFLYPFKIIFSLEAKKKIGYVRQRSEFYPNMTPTELLDFVGNARGEAPDKLARQIKEALELVGLENEANRLIKIGRAHV